MGVQGWFALALVCAPFCRERLYLGGYAHLNDKKHCFCRDADGTDRLPLWVPRPWLLTQRIRPHVETSPAPAPTAPSYFEPPPHGYRPLYDLDPYDPAEVP